MSAAEELFTGGEEVITEQGTDVFLGADELYFQGTKLNTSPRRYIFVQSWGLALSEQEGDLVELSYPGYAEDAAKVVFACLATKEQLAMWKLYKNRREMDFDAWIDLVKPMPGSEVEAEMCNVAAAVMAGWYSPGNAPEDDPKGQAQT